MDKKPLTEHQILRDLARIQMLEFDPSEEDSYEDVGEEHMEDEKTKQLQWKVPTREARDLILAEEIIRFASITDRPCTSQTHQITIDPGSRPNTAPDSEPFLCNRAAKSEKRDEASKNLKFEVVNMEIPATVTSATSSTMNIASETGTSGSEPPQSASFMMSQPLASSFQDAYLPEEECGEARIPIDPQPNTSPHQILVYRANAIPVTNRILAAIAQSELERASSSSPVILQPTVSAETEDCTPKNNGQLFGYFLQNLKVFQEAELSRSSSPDSPAPTSPSPSDRTDELSALNHYLLLVTELEKMISTNIQAIVTSMLKLKLELQTLKKDFNTRLAVLQRKMAETGANQRKEPKGVNTHQQEGTPARHADTVDNTCNQPVVENINENDVQRVDGNDLNVNNVQAVHDTDGNDAAQPEFPEEDDTSGPEWTRLEKRRLSTVIRDLSREMKTTELQQKKARLLKKGRVIAQAIENKIHDINKEIMYVNKRPLKLVALPLDKIQDYDWVKVASVLNAKRSPEECRTYWKFFLHPTINGKEWSRIEVKAMEIIAQRHNFRNWNDIAEELDTGRSGYQCYTFYRKHLCPHSELHGTCNKK